MELIDFYKKVNEVVETGSFEELEGMNPPKPVYFNWVKDIFYPMNIAGHGEDNALIWRYKDKIETFNFNTVYQRGNQILNLLRRYGIEQGDVVYTMLPLIPENWFTFISGMKGGYILMPTAINLVTKDLEYRFKTLPPKVMICHYKHVDEVDQAEALCEEKIQLKIIVGGKKEGWVDFDEINKEAVEAECAKTKSDDPFLYFFTSGTTGLPKIVVHSHFSYPVGHLSTLTWLGCERGGVHYNISSPGWAKFAWSSFFAPWNAGSTILINQTDGFSPKDQLETIEKLKVTTFCGSPTVYRMLVQENLDQYTFSLKKSCAAGEPLNPDIIDKWKKGTGVTIRDGYGQTETTGLVANLSAEKLRPGSMGKPTFLYDVGIFNEEGEEMPPLEEGLICVRMEEDKNNGLFSEYLNDPERTAKVFKHNLYYTGDKAYKDEDGYIWFVGRDDDVIKASAYRIGPFEVESILIEHDDVIESAVVASPHPMRGYAVKAFVMLREGVERTEALAEEIFAFTEKRLAKYKVPRIIEFPDSLPKTISGKIRRIELRANEAKSKSMEEKRAHEYYHAKY